MNKKTLTQVLIGVAALAAAVLLATFAFAGGLIVGRVTGVQVTPEVIRITPEMPDFPPVDETLPPEGTLAPPETDEPAPDPTDEGQQPPSNIGFDYALMQEVLRLLDEQFYGDIPDEQTLAHGAIRGMLLTLDDPYTSFIDPSTAEIIREDSSGEFEGIGAIVTMREDGYLEVVNPMPGQPAENAGIKAGDLILSVNGQSIVGLGLYEAINYVRGPAGSEAELEIVRPGEPETLFITVVRARIAFENVEYEILDDNVAYVRLREFDSLATERVEAALEEMLAENPEGIIFDLRDNPGGWLNQAIGVADLFLDEGLVAIERDSSGREDPFYSYDGDLAEDIPLVVLVNHGSASASEIVAGALQDRERAVLIGTLTVGKGSVQRPNNLSDGSQLRVTIARWFTPDEQMLHNNGLTPDIEVEAPEDLEAGEDPQLDRAIEYLLEGN